MKNKKFIVLLVLIISYVVFIFYNSEPEYINNLDKKPEKYDYVSIFVDRGNVLGVILQTTDSTFTTKVVEGRIWTTDAYFYTLKTNSTNYQLIGKGTFYHKVNHLIGFNIMMTINVLLIGISIGIVIRLLRLFDDY